MDIDPRHVLIFKQVVDAGSISAGARALGWRQPSVTSHIQALEHALGTPLLLRRSTGVTPTEAGRSVLAHAQAIASHLDALQREVKEQRLRHWGSVRLAGFATTLSMRVPRALADLDERFPGIDVLLTENEPAAALQLVDTGSVDVAIVYQHIGDPQSVDLSSYTQVPLATDPVYLILSSDHPLAQREPLALADLAAENWIIGYSSCRHHLIDLCHQAGFEPHIKHETDDQLVIQELVGYRLAVAAVTRSSLTTVRSPNIAIRTLPELGEHQVTAVCLPGAERVASIRALLDALAAVPPRAL
ncbi:MAG: LysR substrate-binding domain-containing protein [Propionibacteriaceae bacterium]|nr:LysR substrate-binding domain-containing protein [Propionibacteriaceae bacterium]